MKKLSVGVLAHVDAGKTTLCEALLYRSGAIRALGRVDHANAFLDTHALERARGITIFSKQARLRLPDTELTLLDTPGHVDFSAEMERTLQVLDYGILVISGTDGVQAHTRTLWQLLERNAVPTFVFVTKMDLPGAERQAVLTALRGELDAPCVDFGLDDAEHTLTVTAAGACAPDAKGNLIALECFYILRKGDLQETAVHLLHARNFPQISWGNWKRPPILLRKGDAEEFLLQF